ncbi:hypothetical protein GEV33_001460 [Tenebrio molitor]|uniref:Uncharacterized protein n=1 Tax=Tenebrio molitor TaxID=7067 RepID=A0A8J6LQ68_TENMO|nr:hypothetical protein GEV33_001460 [Tenebrio molitor]
MLLDHGADINAVDNYWTTVLDADVGIDIEKTVTKKLYDDGGFKRFKRFGLAICYGINMLYSAAKINAVDNFWETVLHGANNIPIVENYNSITNLLCYSCADTNEPVRMDVETINDSIKMLLVPRADTVPCVPIKWVDDDCIKMLRDPCADINGYESFATTRKCLCSSSQPRFDSYKKRNVTGEEDKDYQKMMCVLFALKFSTSNIVAEFEMKTNCDDCGDFNDVALKVTFDDGHSEIFLLQLKHSKNMKKVTEINLAADFSLQKYIKSIRKFENTENVSFILYTNLSTSIESSSKIRLQNKDNTIEEIVVKELGDLDPKKLLLMNRKGISYKKEGTNVFQFEQHHSSRSVEDLDESWKQLYFFGDQTDMIGARSLINAMLRKECGIDDDTYSSLFVEFMETWWSEIRMKRLSLTSGTRQQVMMKLV